MALALVDYGSSGDESEEESEESTRAEIVQKPTVPKLPAEDQTHKNNDSETADKYSATGPDDVELEDGRFDVLPRPISLSQDIAWTALNPGKNRGKVKIYAPAMPDTEPEQETVAKKVLKPSKKGCGLFALLPSPKNQFLVAPAAALKRPNPTTSTAPLAKKPAVPKQDKSPVKKPTPKDDITDESDGEAEDSSDFFSLDKPESPTPVIQDNIDLMFEDPKPVGPVLPANRPPVKVSTPVEHTEEEEEEEDGTSSLELDQEALSRLCGGKASRRNNRDNIEVIDVNYTNLVPDANEWLAKELSQEKSTRVSSSSHKKKHEPTSQQRRKHQITFLAYQAKEQELELKNQWSNNRMTRKQTQAKYGF